MTLKITIYLKPILACLTNDNKEIYIPNIKIKFDLNVFENYISRSILRKSCCSWLQNIILQHY